MCCCAVKKLLTHTMPELSSDDVSVELQEDVEEVSGADGCCMCVGAGAYMATPAPTGRGGGSVFWQRVSLSRLAWPVIDWPGQARQRYTLWGYCTAATATRGRGRVLYWHRSHSQMTTLFVKGFCWKVFFPQYMLHHSFITYMSTWYNTPNITV